MCASISSLTAALGKYTVAFPVVLIVVPSVHKSISRLQCPKYPRSYSQTHHLPFLKKGCLTSGLEPTPTASGFDVRFLDFVCFFMVIEILGFRVGAAHPHSSLENLKTTFDEAR